MRLIAGTSGSEMRRLHSEGLASERQRTRRGSILHHLPPGTAYAIERLLTDKAVPQRVHLLLRRRVVRKAGAAHESLDDSEVASLQPVRRRQKAGGIGRLAVPLPRITAIAGVPSECGEATDFVAVRALEDGAKLSESRVDRGGGRGGRGWEVDERSWRGRVEGAEEDVEESGLELRQLLFDFQGNRREERRQRSRLVEDGVLRVPKLLDGGKGRELVETWEEEVDLCRFVTEEFPMRRSETRLSQVLRC